MSEVPQEGNVASSSSGSSESTDGRTNSNTHVLDAAPTPQNLSYVFSEDSLSANESSQSKSYTTAWRQSKSIQQSILACDIAAQAGAIIPKEYATAIHHQQQQTKMIAVAKSIGNCRKIAEDRKAFITTTLVSMVSSPGKKASKHELDGIQSILGCSRNTAQRTRHRVSAKWAHLQSVQDDKTMKWAVKPRIVRKKKVDDTLIEKIVDWVLPASMQSSLNAWHKTKLKTLTEGLQSIHPSRRRVTLETMLQSYSEFVFPQGEERHSRASLAAASMMCAPTEEHGLQKWSCVLRKCNDCGPLVNHDVEMDVSEGAPIIQFNSHLKQGYCSIHGKLTFRKKLFKLEKKIGEFHEEYYRPSIERLIYHRSYYKILGKNNVAAIRQDAFQNSPGSIATRSDYAEKFSFAPNGQLQGECFSNNRSLSMEGCCLDHFTTPLHLINMQTPGGVAYVPKDEDIQRIVRGGTMYDTTDGCSCQYRCSKAFFLLSVIAAGRRIVIDRAIDAPGHGKGVVDGLNAIDKGYLAKFPKCDDDDPIKMRDLYHIRCDPDLGLGKCAMRQIPCACEACRLSLEQAWQATVDADKQPRYSGHVTD
eukprot:scaffold240978_cov74-Attheya_sp.AAC.1